MDAARRRTQDLHSEQGATRGEHPGRSRNPLIKVRDLAWLEFERLRPGPQKPSRGRCFTTCCRAHRRASPSRNGRRLAVRDRPPDRIRGSWARRSPQSTADVERLASATSNDPHAARGHRRRRGRTDRSRDSGPRRRRDARVGRAARTTAAHLQLARARRANATQRPPREPARVQRLGHVVLQSTKYIETLNWYLDHIGLIVSDFMYYPGQRDRGPVMSFIRCDRGRRPPTITHWLWRWARRTAMCTPRIRRAIWTRSRRAANTYASWGITGRGASAGTSRAARSSTTGAIPTDSWSSTSAMATCSTTPSNRDGRRSPRPVWPSGDHRPPKIFSASHPGGSSSRTAVDSDRDP